MVRLRDAKAAVIRARDSIDLATRISLGALALGVLTLLIAVLTLIRVRTLARA